MIALKVKVNGRRVCVAGADDLAVLGAYITASGKLGRETVPAGLNDTPSGLFYSVGGVTARKDPTKDIHKKWKSTVPLKVGDVIEVTILETEQVDRPRSMIKVKLRNQSKI